MHNLIHFKLENFLENNVRRAPHTSNGVLGPFFTYTRNEYLSPSVAALDHFASHTCAHSCTAHAVTSSARISLRQMISTTKLLRNLRQSDSAMLGRWQIVVIAFLVVDELSFLFC